MDGKTDLNTRYVVVDVKTTGASPMDGDRVVEVGLVEIQKRRLGAEWNSYCNPEGRGSDQKAAEQHGLTHDFLAEQATFGEIHEDFLNFLKHATLVILDPVPTLDFLNAELRRCGVRTPLEESYTVLNMQELADELHPKVRAHSLDSLAKLYEIKGARELRGALIDARLLAKVWLAMTASQESMSAPQRELYEHSKVHTPIAYALWLFLGPLGIHRLYTENLLYGLVLLGLFVLSVYMALTGQPFYKTPTFALWLLDALLLPDAVLKRNRKIELGILG